MSKKFQIVDGDISDGYHTFDDLYRHRCLLFLTLCLQNPKVVFWRPDFEGWFVLYLELHQGQVSYHLPNVWLPIVARAFTRDDEHKFDGHTSDDVLERLSEFARNLS